MAEQESRWSACSAGSLVRVKKAALLVRKAAFYLTIQTGRSVDVGHLTLLRLRESGAQVCDLLAKVE